MCVCGALQHWSFRAWCEGLGLRVYGLGFRVTDCSKKSIVQRGYYSLKRVLGILLQIFVGTPPRDMAIHSVGCDFRHEL